MSDTDMLHMAALETENYDTKKADEQYDKIRKAVGGEE